MQIEKDNILYIDDEVNNLTLFQLSFEKEFNIITTESTQEARKLLSDQKIKVVVSDLRMPIESGIDFIQSVSPQYPDVYFIILTAYLDIDAALKAINQGNTFRYLLKPWDKNQIRTVLLDAIESYNLKIENRKLNALILEREKQFYSIFYYSIDGILIFNENGQILQINPALKKILEIKEEKEPFNLKEIFKDIDAETIEAKLISTFKQSSIPFEILLQLTPYNEKFIEIHSGIIKYAEKPAVISIIRDITDRRLSERKVFNSVLQAEERERNRLASDLHDGIGPILSTCKMYIEWLSDKKREGNSIQILEMALKGIDETIQQIRNISHNLSPHLLDKFGLATGIQSHIDLLKQTSGIEFNLNSNLKRRPHRLVELTLYRALNECINNTIKHANAREVYIVIAEKDNLLNVIYSDNGTGFNIEEIINKSHGIGLYNIRNRIESLGGKVDILSAPKMGTSIKMEIKNAW